MPHRHKGRDEPVVVARRPPGDDARALTADALAHLIDLAPLGRRRRRTGAAVHASLTALLHRPSRSGGSGHAIAALTRSYSAHFSREPVGMSGWTSFATPRSNCSSEALSGQVPSPAASSC